MPKFQLRRPAPLVIVPREDEEAQSGAPESPESPDSPSPASTSFPESTVGLPQASNINASAAQSSIVESKAPAVAGNPPRTSTSAAAVPAVSSSTSTTLPAPQSTVKLSTSQANENQMPQTSQTSPVASSSVSVSSSVAPAISTEAISSSLPQAQSAPVAQPTTSELPTSTTQVSEGQQNTPQPPPRKATSNQDPIITKGAEVGLIVLAILGALSLVIGVILFLRHRRRRRQQQHLRHAENAFSPSNSGSLHTPQTTHLTRSTASSTLFGGEANPHPGIVSIDQNSSQYQAPARNNMPIQPPMQSANPFADPPLNKTYDVLRGRHRSTTLTDRGSWMKNPFKDPVSDRFDPFGELQEKAKEERVRYLQATANQQRKGSNVTVEGMGVLDRSGDSRGYPR